MPTLPFLGQEVAGQDATVDFNKKITPFLENYCFDCHDDETKKGNVSLESLRDVSADNAGMWRRVWEQVALKEMPPRKKTNQPKLIERLEFSKGITDGLTKALKDKGGFTDHLRPSKGNHLDHDLLFNTKLENLQPSSTPARLWRIHPQEQMVRLNDLICNKRKYDPERPGLWTHGDQIPSNLEGEIKVYFGLDGYLGSFSDAYNFGVSGFQSSFAMIRDHGLRNYPFLYSVNSSEAREIAGVAEKVLRFMAYGPAADERLQPVIQFLFESLTLRAPSKAVLALYLDIANKSIKELGKDDGTFLGLVPIFLDRDALFRPELCEGGQPDQYGRVMLQGSELVLAINAAFSYLRPEADHLWAALAEGKLKTREDVKREVTGILNDPSIRSTTTAPPPSARLGSRLWSRGRTMSLTLQSSIV
ncbi:MAG: hypothetical protein NTX04_14370 [Verrucomicrobia bacterium]|nr:hypothetical protein [Verrucomicrobiota bacterium]